MIRRTFLTRALSAAVASLFARNVSAQKAESGMQDMRGMSDMPSMSGGKMHMAATLAPADALPAGAPLAVLRKLTNESSQPGVFLGTLVAQPVHVRRAYAEAFSHMANGEQRRLHSSVW